MPIDSELLKILCCPETRQALRLAEPELITKLNHQVTSGALKNHSGQSVKEPLEAGLLREDRRVVYPIRNGIPVLLIGEAIPLAG
jgi:uncharacterized protein